MSDASPSTPAELGLPPTKDEVDPELLSLPGPPRRGRTLTLAALALAAIGSMAMIFALRSDVVYAVASSTATDLDDLRAADAQALAAHENTRVVAHGMLGAAFAISYERPFSNDSYRALPVAGRDDVWVELRVPEGKDNGRWEPPREFAGRLVPIDAAGPRHRGLADAIEKVTDHPIPKNAWLLVDGESPSASRWSAGLALLLLGFAAWNVGAMVRLVRKVR